jgi:hypothetical protein
MSILTFTVHFDQLMITRIRPSIVLINSNNGVVVHVHRLARQQNDAASLRASRLAAQRIPGGAASKNQQHHLASTPPNHHFYPRLHRPSNPSCHKNHRGVVIPVTSPAGRLSPRCFAQASEAAISSSVSLIVRLSGRYPCSTMSPANKPVGLHATCVHLTG